MNGLICLIGSLTLQDLADFEQKVKRSAGYSLTHQAVDSIFQGFTEKLKGYSRASRHTDLEYLEMHLYIEHVFFVTKLYQKAEGWRRPYQTQRNEKRCRI